MVDTYRARRRLKISPTVWREPGELVPEAHTWYRRDSMLHTGLIEKVTLVDEDLFRSQVERFCPDLAEQVHTAAGLGDTPAVGYGFEAMPISVTDVVTYDERDVHRGITQLKADKPAPSKAPAKKVAAKVTP